MYSFNGFSHGSAKLYGSLVLTVSKTNPRILPFIAFFSLDCALVIMASPDSTPKEHIFRRDKAATILTSVVSGASKHPQSFQTQSNSTAFTSRQRSSRNSNGFPQKSNSTHTTPMHRFNWDILGNTT